jgi:hypothetical protein
MRSGGPGARIRAMTRAPALASLLLLSLSAGCAKHPAVKELEAITDAVCACQTVECAREERKKTHAVIEKYKNDDAYESDRKAIAAAALRLKECGDKLAAGGR